MINAAFIRILMQHVLFLFSLIKLLSAYPAARRLIFPFQTKYFFRRREQPNLQISYQLLFDLEQSVSTTSTFPSKENIDVPFRF